MHQVLGQVRSSEGLRKGKQLGGGVEGSRRSVSQTGLLGEQSDREANECWPNRWVVALLRWRGIAGDALETRCPAPPHQAGAVPGAVFAFRVDLLCTGRQSAGCR